MIKLFLIIYVWLYCYLESNFHKDTVKLIEEGYMFASVAFMMWRYDWVKTVPF